MIFFFFNGIKCDMTPQKGDRVSDFMSSLRFCLINTQIWHDTPSDDSFIFKSFLRFYLINTQMRHDTPSDDRVSILERKKKQKQKTKNKKRRRRRIRWWRKACQYVEQLLLHSNYAVKICLSQWCEVPKYWTIWKSIW